MIAKRILLTFALALLFAASAHAQSRVVEDKSRFDISAFRPQSLQGGWKATITPEEGGPPPFLALFTFTTDGGVVQTDAGPPTPLLFSTGHGAWVRTGPGEFQITYTQFQFDAAQNLIGLFRGRITATLNRVGNELNGSFTADFLDVEGNLIFSGNGTIAAQRLPVLGAN